MNQPIDNTPQKKCEKCGSCDLTKGLLNGTGMGFLPEGKSIFSNVIAVYATACKDCGNLFDFELSKKNLHRLK